MGKKDIENTLIIDMNPVDFLQFNFKMLTDSEFNKNFYKDPEKILKNYGIILKDNLKINHLEPLNDEETKLLISLRQKMTNNGIEGMEKIEYKLNENYDINLMDAVAAIILAVVVVVVVRLWIIR